jgi:hypothetical protein
MNNLLKSIGEIVVICNYLIAICYFFGITRKTWLFNMAINYNYINCKEIETENRRTIEIKDK